MVLDLLSCQVVQVGQLLLMDLEVPEKKHLQTIKQLVLTNDSVLMNFDESAACFNKSLVTSAKRTITQRAY